MDPIFFPSLSSGYYGGYLKKDYHFKNGIPLRYNQPTYPEHYQTNKFLITAGHCMQKSTLDGGGVQKFGFTPTVQGGTDFVMGDSGGFQIASGAKKFDKTLVENTYRWLNNNCDLAINLDIPPRMTQDGKFNECLELSVDNFKKFSDWQAKTGKAKFLNVLQGVDYDSFAKWYRAVSQFSEFAGWSIGGTGSKLDRMITALVVLLENKEHLNPNVEYIHVLGTTNPIDMWILSMFNHYIQKAGSKVIITFDSSTPSMLGAFGSTYGGYSWKNGSFQSIRLSKVDKEFILENGDAPAFQTIPFDRYFRHMTMGEWHQNTPESWCFSGAHALAVIQDTVENINANVRTESLRFLDQITPFGDLLAIIPKIVEADNPKGMLDMYMPVIHKYSNTKASVAQKTNVDHLFDIS